MRFRPILALLAAAYVASAVACDGTGSREPGASANVPGIPVYPGAELIDAWPASSIQTPSHSLSDDTSRDPTDFYYVPDVDVTSVVNWYAERMPAMGWRAVGDPMQDVVLYNDRQGCYGFVGVSAVEGGVDLQFSRQDPATPCQIIPTTNPGND